MCALKVGASDWLEAEFSDPLAAALDRICPGAKVVGDSVDLSDVACSDYCSHRAGCNLLRGLVESDTEITIVAGSPIYLDLTNSANPGQVRFQEDTYNLKEPDCDDPDPCTEDWDACTPIPPVAALAHELIHAWHDAVKESYDYSKYDDLCPNDEIMAEERCTVCAENQIRAELKLPKRCYYTFCPVSCDPDSLAALPAGYTCDLLPTLPEASGCSCKPKWWQVPLQIVELFKKLWGRSSPRVPRPEPPVLRPPASGEYPSAAALRDSRQEASYRRALRALEKGRAQLAPEIWERFAESTNAVMLEIASMAALGYGVYLLHLDAEGPNTATLWTNMDFGPGLVPRVGLGGRVVSKDLPRSAEPTLPRIREGFNELFDRIAAGGGGVSVERGAADGDAHFLWARREGEEVNVAIRGFRFVSWSRDEGRPRGPEDGARWETIRASREYGAEILADFFSD